MRIGKRQIKTVLAVFCCLMLSLVIEICNIKIVSSLYTPFFAALATVYCMCQDRTESFKMAKIRGIGSVLGGVVGFITIYFVEIVKSTIENGIVSNVVAVVLVSVCMIIVIQFTILFKLQKLTFIACLTYLSVTVGMRNGLEPFIFASNRILSSIMGIFIALLINNIGQRKKEYMHLNKVFYLNLDNFSEISGYVRQKLNFYLNCNVKIRLFTNYSPYEVIDKFEGLKINEVLALGGNVSYNIESFKFTSHFPISKDKGEKIEQFLNFNKYHFFKYCLKDNVLICYYDFDLESKDQGFIMNSNKHNFYNFMKSKTTLSVLNYAFSFDKKEKEVIVNFFENFDCFTYLEEDETNCFIRVFDNELNKSTQNKMINFNLEYNRENILIKNQIDIIKEIKKNLK